MLKARRRPESSRNSRFPFAPAFSIVPNSRFATCCSLYGAVFLRLLPFLGLLPFFRVLPFPLRTFGLMRGTLLFIGVSLCLLALHSRMCGLMRGRPLFIGVFPASVRVGICLGIQSARFRNVSAKSLAETSRVICIYLCVIACT